MTGPQVVISLHVGRTRAEHPEQTSGLPGGPLAFCDLFLEAQSNWRWHDPSQCGFFPSGSRGSKLEWPGRLGCELQITREVSVALAQSHRCSKGRDTASLQFHDLILEEG